MIVEVVKDEQAAVDNRWYYYSLYPDKYKWVHLSSKPTGNKNNECVTSIT